MVGNRFGFSYSIICQIIRLIALLFTKIFGNLSFLIQLFLFYWKNANLDIKSEKYTTIFGVFGQLKIFSDVLKPNNFFICILLHRKFRTFCFNRSASILTIFIKQFLVFLVRWKFFRIPDNKLYWKLGFRIFKSVL